MFCFYYSFLLFFLNKEKDLNFSQLQDKNIVSIENSYETLQCLHSTDMFVI